MRTKIDFRSSSKTAYLSFKIKHPTVDLSYADYKIVLQTFNAALVAHILESGDKIKFPFGLGELSVAKFKPRRTKTFTDKSGQTVTISGLPINWQKTRQTGKIIYHLNSHSDGHKYRWKWFKNTARFASSSCFSFRANRTTSRKLGQYLQADPKYPQIYRSWEQ